MATITETRQPGRLWSFRSRVTENLSEEERLEALWQAGRLQRHLESLERFYRSKRPEFQALLETYPESQDLIELAKRLVIEHGIVDHLTETLDQITEIESEIWIQGERGNHDRDRIAAQWTERHAAQWREWRIKEYLFATERMEPRLRDCLLLAG